MQVGARRPNKLEVSTLPSPLPSEVVSKRELSIFLGVSILKGLQPLPRSLRKQLWVVDDSHLRGGDRSYKGGFLRKAF